MPKSKVFIYFLVSIFILVLPNVYSSVLINEVMANGIDDPDSEWIELYNNEDHTVNLINWNVSESSSKNFTLNTIIPAKGFIILAVDYKTFNSIYPQVISNGIEVVDVTINFNLADSLGEVILYNHLGDIVDTLSYVQDSGKKFENVSIARYPDGGLEIYNMQTLTPGAKNDYQAPRIKSWINPSKNNTNISGLTNIVIELMDDTTQIPLAIINFDGKNFSMNKNGDQWTYQLNTTLFTENLYNINVFFNDSYGKSSSDTLFNIRINNSKYSEINNSNVPIVELCDYKVEIYVSSEISEKEEFKLKVKAIRIEDKNDKSTNITGKTKIEHGNVTIKTYSSWNSESVSNKIISEEYTPKLVEGEYKITANIDVGCNDTNKDNNFDVKVIKIIDKKKEQVKNQITEKNKDGRISGQVSLYVRNSSTVKEGNISKKETEITIGKENTAENLAQLGNKEISNVIGFATKDKENIDNGSIVYESSKERLKNIVLISILAFSIFLNVILIWKR